MSGIQKTLECPRCQGTAPLLEPMRILDKRVAVYGCKACGFAFKADGGAYVADTKELRDYFRGGTLANQTLMEALAGEKLNPATKILLQARLVEYGTQMWFDGLKQGLMMGAASAQELEARARACADYFQDNSDVAPLNELKAFLAAGKENT
jgi:hypothetical protein